MHYSWTPGRWVENDERLICTECGQTPQVLIMGDEHMLSLCCEAEVE